MAIEMKNTAKNSQAGGKSPVKTNFMKDLLKDKTFRQDWDCFEQYGLRWVRIDDLIWSKETKKSGIHCGITREQLNNLLYLQSISATNYFLELEKKHFKKVHNRIKKHITP